MYRISCETLANNYSNAIIEITKEHTSDQDSATIVLLTEEHLLQQLCGVNDSHIRYMEQVLHTRLVVRGNCLYIDSQQPRLRQQLQHIMAMLEKYVTNGRPIDEKIIDAIIADTQHGNNHLMNLLQEQQIDIKGSKRRILPRTVNQAHYMSAMRTNPVVIAIGPAGTGKTYLAVSYALARLLRREIARLVIVRPVVEAGEHLGFLPGDMEQKLNPYMQPIYDVLERLLPLKEIENLHAQKAIEIIPLAYMRGRSLVNSCVVLDEAQNSTVRQMMMLLTRIGEGSQAIVTGDITQIDLPQPSESGLIRAQRVLDNINQIAIINLDSGDIVRNPLLCRIIKAFNNSGS